MHAANVERDAADIEREAEIEGLKKAVDELRSSSAEKEAEIKRLHADLEAAREKAQGGSGERAQDDGAGKGVLGGIDLNTFESLLAAAEAFEASQQASTKVDAAAGGEDGEALEVLGRVLEGAEWLERDARGVDEGVPSSPGVGLGAVEAESTRAELERLGGMVSLLEADLKKAHEELFQKQGVEEELSRVRDSLKVLQEQRQDGTEETDRKDQRVNEGNQNQGVVDQADLAQEDVAKSEGAWAGELQQQSEVEDGQSGEENDDLLEYYKTRVAKISKEIKGVRDERDAVCKEKKELVSKVESLEKM